MPDLLLELFSEGELRCAKHMSNSSGLAKAANARSVSAGREGANA